MDLIFFLTGAFLMMSGSYRNAPEIVLLGLVFIAAAFIGLEKKFNDEDM